MFFGPPPLFLAIVARNKLSLVAECQEKNGLNSHRSQASRIPTDYYPFAQAATGWSDRSIKG